MGSAKELSSAMEWQRDALKATTLRDWRPTKSCRSRTSCTHSPRQRNGWMTWHSERSLRRARWSTRRWRWLYSWCWTCRKTSCRSLQSQWLLQPHRALPNRLCQILQDMTYTSRKPAKPRILVLDVSSARKPMRRTMAKGWAKAVRRTRRCARFGKWTSKASPCTAMGA